MNPDVLKRIRAENHISKLLKNYEASTKIMPILIYGDASFSGQKILLRLLKWLICKIALLVELSK